LVASFLAFCFLIYLVPWQFPKAEELVATPYRHGSKEKAERFFLEGMTQACTALPNRDIQHFLLLFTMLLSSQKHETDKGVASTGWETFLEAAFFQALQ
jgi:putative DNA methylase